MSDDIIELLKSLKLDKATNSKNILYSSVLKDEGVDLASDLLNYTQEELISDFNMRKGHAKRILKYKKDMEEKKDKIEKLEQKEDKIPLSEDLDFLPKNKIPDESITICVLGKCGNGKSTIINRFFGDTSYKGNKGPCEAKTDSQSVTKHCSVDTKYIRYKKYRNKIIECNIIDTPGLKDPSSDDKDLLQEVKKFFSLTCKGVNLFLIVMKVQDVRFEQPTQEILYGLTKLFGEKFWNHVMIVLSRFDKQYGRLIPGVQTDYNATESSLSNNILNMFKERRENDWKNNRLWSYLTGVKLSNGIKHHIKGDLRFTGFGVNNYYDGIKDVLDYSLNKGVYKCSFMNLYDKFGFSYKIGGIKEVEEELKKKNSCIIL